MNRPASTRTNGAQGSAGAHNLQDEHLGCQLILLRSGSAAADFPACALWQHGLAGCLSRWPAQHVPQHLHSTSDQLLIQKDARL